MTKAKAATVMTALVNADYEPNLRLDNGDYVITVAVAIGNGALINTIKSFQDTQVIIGTTKVVEFR